MAAPVDASITLPTDTGNSGKKVRTQTRVVGSSTVHEHFFIPTAGYARTGRYMASSTANQVISATSQTGTGSGFYWLHMSTAATVTGVLRHVSASWGISGTVVAALTAPIVSVQKFTFNTAFSGTTLNILPTQTTATAAQANIRSTSSGATVTLVGQVAALPVPALVTTVASYGGNTVLYDVSEQYTRGTGVEFGPGEGLVVFQPTAGTASDVRLFNMRLVWDEIDLST